MTQLPTNAAAAAQDMYRILNKILRAHDSKNNGAVMGEATLCQAFATEARYAINKAEENTHG
jgi:hypothetical protein